MVGMVASEHLIIPSILIDHTRIFAPILTRQLLLPYLAEMVTATVWWYYLVSIPDVYEPKFDTTRTQNSSQP